MGESWQAKEKQEKKNVFRKLSKINKFQILWSQIAICFEKWLQKYILNLNNLTSTIKSKRMNKTTRNLMKYIDSSNKSLSFLRHMNVAFTEKSKYSDSTAAKCIYSKSDEFFEHLYQFESNQGQ